MLDTQRQLLKSALPALREYGETIARIFYEDLLESNPELRPMFTTSDQNNGAQGRRLAGAIIAYVSNIDRLDLLGPAVANISGRHVKTQVKPEHYPIVGKHLLKAIKAVLGDSATPEIMNAWTAAYTELADIMIEREKQMYAQETGSKATGSNFLPKALIIGSTGRIGSKLIAELESTGAVQVVYASRSQDQVARWREAGKAAAFLDLDRPETFSQALHQVDRLFLSTGYTVAMLQQSKTLIDAAAEAGVTFIVHLGIFGNGHISYSYGAWHELVERYIEGSGVAWSHLHPHFFMDNLLAASPIVDGTLHWFMGDQAVGWIAPDDVARVAATVLAEGPKLHHGRQYWLATEMLNGSQAALKLTEALGTPIASVNLTPNDLASGIKSGHIRMPGYMDESYAHGVVEWIRQTYEGKLDFSIPADSITEITGRNPLSLIDWAVDNKGAILAAGQAEKEGAYEAVIESFGGRD